MINLLKANIITLLKVRNGFNFGYNFVFNEITLYPSKPLIMFTVFRIGE